VRAGLWFCRFAACSAVAGELTAGPGCSNPAPEAYVDAALDHVSTPTVPDAATAPEAGSDAAPLGANVRVALVSSLGFGVDICVTSASSTQGPLLYAQHQLQTELDAGSRDAGREAGDGGRVDAGSTRLDGAADGRLDAPLDALRSQSDAGRDGPKDAPIDAASDTTLEGARDATLDGRHDATLDGARDATLDALLDADASGRDAGSAMDGGTPFGGVLAEQVTNYLTISGAGTFDVTVVTGGSSTCGICPLAHRLVTLDSGKFYTLVVGAPTPVAGDGGGDSSDRRDAPNPSDAAAAVDGADATRADAARTCPPTTPLVILPLTDEPALGPSARARFFNATNFNPSLGDGGILHPFRVAIVEQNAVVPLASEIPPGQTALPNPANPGVDTLGYWAGGLSTTSLVDLRIGAPVDAGPDASVDGGVGQPSWTFVAEDNFDLLASTVHTGFIAGGSGSPLTLLWCSDSTMIGAVYTTCELHTGQ
jgi:hypothetical protein